MAVGERGVIALSDDAGRTWRQAPAPTSVSLVTVAFASPQIGWAAGHAGTILRTVDGGEHWQRLLNGNRAAALVTRDAGAARGTGAAELHSLARQLAADGADAPFLAIRCFDERAALVAGANGLLFATSDGGATWQSLVSRAGNSTGRHYYAIAARDRLVYVAGEAGLLERSLDGGRTFNRVATPYGGTFFGVALLQGGAVLLAGLRGTVLWSGDGGRHFERVSSPTAVSFSSMTPTPEGALLTDQGGGIVRFSAASRRLVRLPGPPLFPLAGAALAADGAIVAVGLGGAVRVPLPSEDTR